jgi:hypothetical protein
LKRLLKNDFSRYQKRGSFDEHLISLNSQVYGDPYIYEDTYPVYYDRTSKMIWVTLFELKRQGNAADRHECLKTVIAQFEPRRITTCSPEKLDPKVGEYLSGDTFFDKDYQINLDKFDDGLRGGSYESLRYRIKNAIKHGYRLASARELTLAHSYITAVHMSKRDYNLWDYQLFLRLGNYVGKSPEVKLFNVFLDDVLIGFDVVDFLGDTMAVPLGFCLDYSSLADFLMYKEILYAKEHGFKWLDVGWACSRGVEDFKRKWKGIPRFDIYVQEYYKKLHQKPEKNI